MRRHWIDRRRRFRRTPPVVPLYSDPRMIVHPLLQNRASGTVAAVAIDEQDTSESGPGEAVENIGDNALISFKA